MHPYLYSLNLFFIEAPKHHPPPHPSTSTKENYLVFAGRDLYLGKLVDSVIVYLFLPGTAWQGVKGWWLLHWVFAKQALETQDVGVYHL